MSVELDAFDDQPGAKDYRRANGAPMVSSGLNDGKFLRYSRPSGWGHDLDDESALVLWKIDRAMDGMAASPALVAKVVAAGKTGRKALREEAINKGRGEEASEMGTALHAMTVKHETEEGWKAPEPFDSDLAAYSVAMEAAGLKSAFIEVPMCNDDLRAAGTADRIFETVRELLAPDGSRIPPGTLLMGDIKTGSKLDYSLPGYFIQLAIYADGVMYDVDHDVRLATPDIHRRWGLLVHLPAGTATCKLVWVDLDVGRHGAQLVRSVREWRKRDWTEMAFTMPDDDIVNLLEKSLGATIEVDRRLDSDVDDPAIDWNGDMTEFALSRIATIGAHSEARAMLMRLWPEHVPPIRKQQPDDRQLKEILDVLDKVETAFSLPWPEGDPRPGYSTGHKSRIHTSNTPATKESQQ
jgi:hypothetical protein